MANSKLKPTGKYINGHTVVSDGRYEGIRNHNNRIIIEPKYDCIECDGFNYITKRNLKMGLRSINGKLLLPCKYDSINYLTDSFYSVKNNSKYKFYSVRHDKLSKHSYDDVIYSSIGKLGARKGEKYFYFDDNGKCVFKGTLEQYMDYNRAATAPKSRKPRTKASKSDGVSVN